MTSQKYRELEQLLKAQEWRKADELTAKLMCQVAGREKEGWLREEDIQQLPWEDLQTIDQLWVHYSNSKFGFSVQKRLWIECVGKIDKYDYEGWKKFATIVGWYHPNKDDWRTGDEFINDTKNAQNAILASLPRGCFLSSIGMGTLRKFMNDLDNRYGYGYGGNLTVEALTRRWWGLKAASLFSHRDL